MIERRTALLVLVPEAEAAVGPLRRELDPVAILGVPSHLTVLFPFVAAHELTDEVMKRLDSIFGRCSEFGYNLVRTGWFGDEVLWLAPDVDEPFRKLTDAVWAEFPDCPPYGGQFDDIVAHLTIARVSR